MGHFHGREDDKLLKPNCYFSNTFTGTHFVTHYNTCLNIQSLKTGMLGDVSLKRGLNEDLKI